MGRIDWFVTNDPRAVSDLRVEVRRYLERHASPDSDIGGAELAFSELLTNAVEHTDGDVWVTLDWAASRPVVTINDLGTGFEVEPGQGPRTVDPSSPAGRGLMVASHLTRELSVGAKRAGGSRVTAVLDVEREPSTDHDFAPSSSSRLPEIDEAKDGFFQRESFLRALIVELAGKVEFDHGPDAAEAAIAQLGANVGGSMETAHRRHEGLEEPLTAGQMAEFYVELKGSIGGDFYIVDVDDRRIVLGNRRCPFGEAVRHAPSLCRMTSSVFGGVAARNTGHDVAVHLEERIAVGDPECRVVVWLEGAPEGVAVSVHRYRQQSAV